MRYKTKPKNRKEQENMDWLPWFAWRPVKTVDNEWVWLERVERISWWSTKVRVTAPYSFFYWSFRTRAPQVPA